MKEFSSVQLQVLVSALKVNEGLHSQVFSVVLSPVPYLAFKVAHEKHFPFDVMKFLGQLHEEVV